MRWSAELQGGSREKLNRSCEIGKKRIQRGRAQLQGAQNELCAVVESISNSEGVRPKRAVLVVAGKSYRRRGYEPALVGSIVLKKTMGVCRTVQIPKVMGEQEFAEC